MNKTEQELSRITTIDFSPLKFMSFMPTDPQEVRSIILGLRSKSASGLDKITAKILKQNFFSLVPPITYMCNMSLDTGSFPDTLKRAFVCPIFKSRKRNEPNNYRPISLLSTLSKILEKNCEQKSHEIIRTKQAPQ